MKTLIIPVVMLTFFCAGCDSSFTSRPASRAGAIDPFPPGESQAPPTIGGGEPGIVIEHSDEPADTDHAKAAH